MILANRQYLFYLN